MPVRAVNEIHPDLKRPTVAGYSCLMGTDDERSPMRGPITAPDNLFRPPLRVRL